LQTSFWNTSQNEPKLREYSQHRHNVTQIMCVCDVALPWFSVSPASTEVELPLIIQRWTTA